MRMLGVSLVILYLCCWDITILFWTAAETLKFGHLGLTFFKALTALCQMIRTQPQSHAGQSPRSRHKARGWFCHFQFYQVGDWHFNLMSLEEQKQSQHRQTCKEVKQLTSIVHDQEVENFALVCLCIFQPCPVSGSFSNCLTALENAETERVLAAAAEFSSWQNGSLHFWKNLLLQWL